MIANDRNLAEAICLSSEEQYQGADARRLKLILQRDAADKGMGSFNQADVTELERVCAAIVVADRLREIGAFTPEGRKRVEGAILSAYPALSPSSLFDFRDFSLQANRLPQDVRGILKDQHQAYITQSTKLPFDDV